ncbi:MAG: O-antigen ligase family protein [Acidobacteria bacterium]|nr:O-antigen ligase family protein [Acidobacteriota bacterium]
MKKSKIIPQKETFLRTLRGILLLLFFITLPVYKGSTSNDGIMIFQSFLLIFIFASVMPQIFRTGRLRKLITIDLIIILAIALCFFHILFSVEKYSSIMLFTNVLLTGLFFIFYLNPMDEMDLHRLWVFFIPGYIIQVIVGIYQLFFTNIEALRGSFRDPNYYGLYLTVGALITLGFALFESRTKFFLKVIIYSSIPIVLILIIMTKSRSAAGIFMILLTGILLFKKPKYSIIGIALIAMVIILPNPYKNQIKETHETDPYAYTRIDIYKMDLKMFVDHMIVGTGLGCFEEYSPEYNFPVETVIGRYRQTPRQAHSSYFHWIIETGLPGLALLGIFFYIVLKSYLINITNILKKRRKPNYTTGIHCALLAMLLMALFHNALHNNAIFLLTILSVSTVLKTANMKRYKTKDFVIIKILREWRLLAIASTVVIFICLFYFLIYAPWRSQDKIEMAQNKYDFNQYKDALRYSEEAIRLMPLFPKAYIMRGQIYQDHFHRNENLNSAFTALFEYEKAAEIAPRNLNVLDRQLEILIFIEEYIHKSNPSIYLPDLEERIIRLYEKKIALAPKNVFTLYNYSNYLAKKNIHENAIRLLLHATELEPNFVGAHRILGELYMIEGNAKESQYHLQKVLEIQSKYNYKDYIEHDHYLAQLLR